MKQPGGRRGRPRQWADTAARQQAYGQRRTAKARAVEALLHAVRNARLDAALQAAVNAEDDVVLLEALTAYYRARYWMLPAGK